MKKASLIQINAATGEMWFRENLLSSERRRMLRSIPPILTLALCAACMHTSPAPAADQPSRHSYNTLAFVQAACGGCHALEANGLSPNPQAPRWADIANQHGLDRETLTNWLADAHNYPEMMDFDLDPDQVEMIADYMLTLRSQGYIRQPD